MRCAVSDVQKRAFAANIIASEGVGARLCNVYRARYDIRHVLQMQSESALGRKIALRPNRGQKILTIGQRLTRRLQALAGPAHYATWERGAQLQASSVGSERVRPISRQPRLGTRWRYPFTWFPERLTRLSRCRSGQECSSAAAGGRAASPIRLSAEAAARRYLGKVFRDHQDVACPDDVRTSLKGAATVACVCRGRAGPDHPSHGLTERCPSISTRTIPARLAGSLAKSV